MAGQSEDSMSADATREAIKRREENVLDIITRLLARKLVPTWLVEDYNMLVGINEQVAAIKEGKEETTRGESVANP